MPERPPPSSYPRPPPFELRVHPLRNPFPSILLFGCAHPPVATFRDGSTTSGPLSNCLDASPKTGRDRLPEPSELAGAGGMDVPESVGGLEDEGAIDAARPGDVGGGLGRCLLPHPNLTLLSERRRRWLRYRWEEQRMRFRSSAASWSQPERTPSVGPQRLVADSFAKRCGRLATLFPLGISTGGGSGLLFGIVLLGCLSRKSL